MNAFPGWLTGYQGLLTLTPNKASRFIAGLEDLRCSDRSITWVHQRLFPPWLNEGIDVKPESEYPMIRVRIARGNRKVVRAQLLAAGFHIVDKKSWQFRYGPAKLKDG